MSHQKEVEAILEKGNKNGVLHYLVKWKGSDRPEPNSWEPITNMDCQDLVEDYEAKLKAKRSYGFERGLTAEKIIGATQEPGEPYLVVKVSRPHLSSSPSTSQDMRQTAFSVGHLMLHCFMPVACLLSQTNSNSPFLSILVGWY